LILLLEEAFEFAAELGEGAVKVEFAEGVDAFAKSSVASAGESGQVVLDVFEHGHGAVARGRGRSEGPHEEDGGKADTGGEQKRAALMATHIVFDLREGRGDGSWEGDVCGDVVGYVHEE
jgi:hypothetical protein